MSPEKTVLQITEMQLLKGKCIFFDLRFRTGHYSMASVRQMNRSAPSVFSAIPE